MSISVLAMYGCESSQNTFHGMVQRVVYPKSKLLPSLFGMMSPSLFYVMRKKLAMRFMFKHLVLTG